MYIQETFEGAADVTNLISSQSRFSAVPRNCRLILECEANDGNDSTNFATITIQNPDGDTPVEGVRIPLSATYGGLDARTKAVYSMNVQQGGHLQVQVDVTGTCRYLIRITIEFQSMEAYNAFQSSWITGG